jgi:hypothetical protein
MGQGLGVELEPSPGPIVDTSVAALALEDAERAVGFPAEGWIRCRPVLPVGPGTDLTRGTGWSRSRRQARSYRPSDSAYPAYRGPRGRAVALDPTTLRPPWWRAWTGRHASVPTVAP